MIAMYIALALVGYSVVAAIVAAIERVRVPDEYVDENGEETSDEWIVGAFWPLSVTVGGAYIVTRAIADALRRWVVARRAARTADIPKARVVK